MLSCATSWRFHKGSIKRAESWTDCLFSFPFSPYLECWSSSSYLGLWRNFKMETLAKDIRSLGLWWCRAAIPIPDHQTLKLFYLKINPYVFKRLYLGCLQLTLTLTNTPDIQSSPNISPTYCPVTSRSTPPTHTNTLSSSQTITIFCFLWTVCIFFSLFLCSSHALPPCLPIEVKFRCAHLMNFILILLSKCDFSLFWALRIFWSYPSWHIESASNYHYLDAYSARL